VCASNLADEVLDGSHLFLATVRQPNTDDLGLETVGVRLNAHGIVQVGDRLTTNIANIWAVGDIRGGPAFTQTAYDDFRSHSLSAMARIRGVGSSPMQCSQRQSWAESA
jgi:pyruvate/2-oxoglutarate dehydrogenase complex dihydrolipoamide dehydrogenase (E3) component